MGIADLSGRVVQKQYRALLADKKLFQCEDLPPITQSALREQPELRKGVDHDARRRDALDLLQQALRGFAELDLRGMKERVVLLRRELSGGAFSKCHPVERPAVGSGNCLKLLLRLREREK